VISASSGRGQRFAYSDPTDDLATLVLVHTPNFQFGSERFAAPEQQQPSNESAA
jgi:hypothetical protein